MQASDYFDRIASGYECGVERPSDPNVDRKLRDMINTANKNGDCIISGRGRYYRPIRGREDEEHEARIYFKQEYNRARDILYKRSKMMEAYKWAGRREKRVNAESVNLQGSSEITDIAVDEGSSIQGQMVMRMS